MKQYEYTIKTNGGRTTIHIKTDRKLDESAINDQIDDFLSQGEGYEWTEVATTGHRFPR